MTLGLTEAGQYIVILFALAMAVGAFVVFVLPGEIYRRG